MTLPMHRMPRNPCASKGLYASKFVGLVLLAQGMTTSPAAASEAESDIIAITNVTVIVGDGSAPQAERTVVIRDGRIVQVTAARNYLPPVGAELIVANGGYLVPGFVDTHAHFALGPVSVEIKDGNPLMSVKPLDSVVTMTSASLLAHGVTTARDPGGVARITVATRHRIASGEMPGPELQVAGDVIDTSRFENIVATVDSIASIRTEVARQAEAGVDWIKLYVGLNPNLVQAAIDEAHARGLKVTGHLQATTWTDAAQLGIDSLVHIMPGSSGLLPEEVRERYAGSMTSTLFMLRWFDLVDQDSPAIREMIRALLEYNVSIDPTLIVLHSMANGDRPRYRENPMLRLMPPEMLQNWRTTFNFNLGWHDADFETAREIYPKVADFTKMLFDAGVPLTAGTDANNPWIVPGDSFHTELELLTATGIPPLDVLTIATYNGAKALGLLDQVGSITPGKRADLVLLRRDPTKNISATRDILWVMQRGQRYFSNQLLSNIPAELD